VVGGQPGRPPGPRGAGGYVRELDIPKTITTATRPYPRITQFFVYPPSPSRRTARTHARFCTTSWGKFKPRHDLKSGPGAPSQRATPPEFTLNIFFSIGGTAPSKTQKKIGDERRESALRASFPLANEISLQINGWQPHKPSGL
jgi:hypothetical protein